MKAANVLYCYCHCALWVLISFGLSSVWCPCYQWYTVSWTSTHDSSLKVFCLLEPLSSFLYTSEALCSFSFIVSLFLQSVFPDMTNVKLFYCLFWSQEVYFTAQGSTHIVLDNVSCQNRSSDQEYEFQQLLPLVNCSGPGYKWETDYSGIRNMGGHENHPEDGLLVGRQVHGVDHQVTCYSHALRMSTCVIKRGTRYNLQY